MKDAGVAFNRFRFDPAFQRGFEAGGRLLGQASMVLGGYDCPVSAAASQATVVFDSPEEEELSIAEWARMNGVWYANPKDFMISSGFRFYGFGGEAQVYSESDSYVHKICRTGQYDSLSLFFDRIVIQNTICPPAALLIEGFGRDEQDDFVVIMKQRFFRQSYIMTEDEIIDYMRRIGFRDIRDDRFGNVRFYSNQVVAEDLHTGNIWMTAGSNVVIIDGAFRFNVNG